MTEYKIEIPAELEAIIIAEGYDTHSWIHTMAINPLVKRLKKKMQDDALVLVEQDIEDSIKKAKKKIKIKKLALVEETDPKQ